MSSTVCQGLQTCLEPGLAEHRATALRLVSPKPHLLHRTEPPAASPAATIALSAPNTAEQQCHNNSDFGTFASVFSPIQTSKESCPIQPLRTTSLPTRLTKMSFELCTENLGCETGTDLTNTDFSSHSSCSSNPNGAETSKLRVKPKLPRSATTARRKENSRSFPPPLTSISGQSSVHMRPHREGGRLILKAVTVPSSHACLEAERTEGRLRLRLVSRNPLPMDAVGHGEDEGKMSENESTPAKAQTKEEEEEEGERGGESRAVCLGEGRRNGKDDRRNMGTENEERGEIGIGKYQRPGRCKEGGHGNKGLLNWEPFWVASS